MVGQIPDRSGTEGVSGLRATFDAAWRRRALAGDGDAVKALAEAVLQPLYHFCLYRVGRNRHLCEEVVQETLIHVSKQMPQFKYDPAVGSFRGWLLKTTGWKIVDQFRKRRLVAPAARIEPAGSKRTATIDRVPAGSGCELDRLWDEEWSKNVFCAAIERVKRQVNARQYQLFDLYVIKEWPVEKIARTLGVRPGRVYLAKHRISELIKKEVRSLETATG